MESSEYPEGHKVAFHRACDVALAYCWDLIYKGGIEAAKQHHNVIMTPTSHVYLDYYPAEPETEPLAIGGFSPLEEVYNFEPVPEELTAEESRYILGTQGNVWTEYVHSGDKVEYTAYLPGIGDCRSYMVTQIQTELDRFLATYAKTL